MSGHYAQKILFQIIRAVSFSGRDCSFISKLQPRVRFTIREEQLPAAALAPQQAQVLGLAEVPDPVVARDLDSV